MDFEKLAAAIKSRRSRRKYLNETIDQSRLDQLFQTSDTLETPFEHQVDIKICRVPEDVSYLYFKEPEYLAAFIASGTLLDQAKLGFVGELFILAAESLKIGTCWIGHYKKGPVYQCVCGGVPTESSRIIHAITPLGIVSEQATGFTDRLTEVLFSRPKRNIAQNLADGSLKVFPESIRAALGLACRAPSALNCQCWYFKVSGRYRDYQVEISKPVGYVHPKWPHTDIDVGAAAAHFWVGLRKVGLEPKVSLTEEEGRAVWRFSVR